jgi:hypothetical protein
MIFITYFSVDFINQFTKFYVMLYIITYISVTSSIRISAGTPASVTEFSL